MVRTALLGPAFVIGVLTLAIPVAAEPSTRPTLTVVGEGASSARSDTAVVSVGVVAQAERAEAALAQNSRAMGAVLDTAKAAGIAPADLRTSQVSLHPQYARPSAREAPPVIAGYEAQNSVAIRVRDLAKLGALIDKLVVAGSNQIRGIELSVAEPGPLRDAARAAAMKDAIRKANLLAEAAGVRIVRLVSIVEGVVERPQPFNMRMTLDAPASRPEVPIEAGEQEFRGRVTAIFEIE